jgi:hypothetical protein
MAIINFLFRDQAMFAVEQPLQEPMLTLTYSGMRQQGKGKISRNSGKKYKALTYMLIVATKDSEQATPYSSFSFSPSG